MKKILAFFLLLFIGTQAICQHQPVISGTVTTGKNEPVTAGIVWILSAKDSSVMKSGLIKEGKFQLGPISAGAYIVKINCLGFDDQLKSIDLQTDLVLNFALTPQTATLDEVKVNSTKRLFTTKGGNLLVNVQNPMLASIPNPIDLLAKLPTVQVSPDGQSISLIGKGEPLLYLDNQKISMNELQSLSVNDIKTIEIINNPSAKYEAEGRAVILITRKLDKGDGVKLDLAETANFKTYYHNNASANLSVKKKKLEMKTGIQYNNIHVWEGNDYAFRIGDDISSGYSVVATTRRWQAIGNLGIFYQFNDKDYLSASTTLRTQAEHFPIYTQSQLQDPATTTNVTTFSLNQNKRLFSTTNINYNRDLKKINSQLFTGVQYSSYDDGPLSSQIYNTYDNAQQELTQQRRQHFQIAAGNLKADLETNFGNGGKWENGVNVSLADAQAFLYEQDLDPAAETSSLFRYRENNYAAYTQYSGKVKKWSYSGGLRAENTVVRSGYPDSALTIDKNYTQLFPKLSADYQIDSLRTLSFNYARTINRPDYSTLSQRTTYINPFFEWQSNININPAITDAITTIFQYKENSASLVFYKTTGPVYPSFQYNTAQQRLERMDKNFLSETGINLNVSIPLQHGKWSSTNVVSATFDKIKDDEPSSGRPVPYVYVYTNQQLQLPKGYSFSVAGFALTRRNEGAFQHNFLFQLDTSVSKTFNKKLICAINFTDMFRSLRFREDLNINTIASSGIFYDDARNLSISLRYSLGSIGNSKYKNKDVDDNSNRIK